MDFICGKRLAAILPEVIPILEKHREIVLSGEARTENQEADRGSIRHLESGTTATGNYRVAKETSQDGSAATAGQNIIHNSTATRLWESCNSTQLY